MEPTKNNKDAMSIADSWRTGKPKREHKPKVEKVKPEIETVNNEKSIVEKVLRDFFLDNGKTAPNNPSVRAMQQFLRFTDGITAGKNVAGGSLFTSNNCDKKENREVYRSVYANVARLKEPIWYIRTILQDNKKLDI